MARSSLLRLTCDFCGYEDTFDQNVDPSADKLHKWLSLGRLDDPAMDPRTGRQVDSSRWYDTIECLTAGVAREDRERTEQQEQDRVLAKAQAELKRSPYMTDSKVEVGKA